MDTKDLDAEKEVGDILQKAPVLLWAEYVVAEKLLSPSSSFYRPIQEVGARFAPSFHGVGIGDDVGGVDTLAPTRMPSSSHDHEDNNDNDDDNGTDDDHHHHHPPRPRPHNSRIARYNFADVTFASIVSPHCSFELSRLYLRREIAEGLLMNRSDSKDVDIKSRTTIREQVMRAATESRPDHYRFVDFYRCDRFRQCPPPLADAAVAAANANATAPPPSTTDNTADPPPLSFEGAGGTAAEPTSDTSTDTNTNTKNCARSAVYYLTDPTRSSRSVRCARCLAEEDDDVRRKVYVPTVPVCKSAAILEYLLFYDPSLALVDVSNKVDDNNDNDNDNDDVENDDCGNVKTVTSIPIPHRPFLLPLFAALRSGKNWHNGTRFLFEAAPETLRERDEHEPTTRGFFPFMVAAAAAAAATAVASESESDMVAAAETTAAGTMSLPKEDVREKCNTASPSANANANANARPWASLWTKNTCLDEAKKGLHESITGNVVHSSENVSGNKDECNLERLTTVYHLLREDPSVLAEFI